MPVKLRQLVAFLILPASLVLFPACDDPTSAGLELAGGPTGEPVAYAAAPSTFESAEIEDITGNSASVLTGQVADPLLGTIETKGYIDFILAANVTRRVRSRTGNSRLAQTGRAVPLWRHDGRANPFH